MDYLTAAINDIKQAKRALLQLSGGKDSRCTLLALLEAGCDDFEIAWVDSGDAPAETLEFMQLIRRVFKDRFHRIASDSFAVRTTYGLPSPLLLARDGNGWQPLTHIMPVVQNQYDCCCRTFMLPMHRFVTANGYDLVIRGTRRSDPVKAPEQPTDIGYKVVCPIYDWESDTVTAFLSERDLLPACYEYTTSGVDCTTCPAYWGNGYQRYLAATDPKKAELRRQQIQDLLIYFSAPINQAAAEIGLTNEEN